MKNSPLMCFILFAASVRNKNVQYDVQKWLLTVVTLVSPFILTFVTTKDTISD